MILFIWVSIHIPQVDIDIVVNSSFKFIGRFMVDRFSRDVVISKILSIVVFNKLLFIKCIGNVLKNIIVPRIVISVFIFVFILLDIVVDSLFCFKGLFSSVLGFIRSIIIMLDKILVIISNMAILWLKIAFKYVYVNINDVYLVVLSNLVISSLYLLSIYALDGEPDIILSIYRGLICKYLFM